MILAAGPADFPEAAAYCRIPAHMNYRIGNGSVLLRCAPPRLKGGLLAVSDKGAPPIDHPETLCAAVLRECGRQSFRGVLLDFEEPPQRDRFLFARQLETSLTAQRKELYLPETYAIPSSPAIVLINTAVSGGNYEERLREAAACRGGASRLALDVQRLRMDFTLPAPSGEGTPLSAEDFRRLTEQEQPSVFFSPDLCARYFTYARDGKAHFVLFDDAETVRRKVKMGASLGCSAAVFLWPEIRDIAGDLHLG